MGYGFVIIASILLTIFIIISKIFIKNCLKSVQVKKIKNLIHKFWYQSQRNDACT